MKCVSCKKAICKNHHRLCDKCWGLREKLLNKMIKKDSKNKWDKRMTRKQMINIIKLNARKRNNE